MTHLNQKKIIIILFYNLIMILKNYKKNQKKELLKEININKIMKHKQIKHHYKI